MSDEVANKISKLEWTIDQHESKLASLSDTTHHLKKSLYGIEKTLIQLKWFAIGMIALYLLDQLGMTEIIKLMR